MKLFYIIIFLFINIFSFNTFSQTIAVVNIQSLIDNNKIYQKTVNDIEINQKTKVTIDELRSYNTSWLKEYMN